MARRRRHAESGRSPRLSQRLDRAPLRRRAAAHAAGRGAHRRTRCGGRCARRARTAARPARRARAPGTLGARPRRQSCLPGRALCRHRPAAPQRRPRWGALPAPGQRAAGPWTHPFHSSRRRRPGHRAACPLRRQRGRPQAPARPPRRRGQPRRQAPPAPATRRPAAGSRRPGRPARPWCPAARRTARRRPRPRPPGTCGAARLQRAAPLGLWRAAAWRRPRREPPGEAASLWPASPASAAGSTKVREWPPCGGRHCKRWHTATRLNRKPPTGSARTGSERRRAASGRRGRRLLRPAAPAAGPACAGSGLTHRCATCGSEHCSRRTVTRPAGNGRASSASAAAAAGAPPSYARYTHSASSRQLSTSCARRSVQHSAST